MTIDNLSRFAIAASIILASILLYLRPTADRYKNITPKNPPIGIVSQYLDSSEGKIYTHSYVEGHGMIAIYDIASGNVTKKATD